LIGLSDPLNLLAKLSW